MELVYPNKNSQKCKIFENNKLYQAFKIQNVNVRTKIL